MVVGYGKWNMVGNGLKGNNDGLKSWVVVRINGCLYVGWFDGGWRVGIGQLLMGQMLWSEVVVGLYKVGVGG
ncbi:hypothetical protein [Candidatus Hodgkinia cicadicola]|uniref:hypothetical protein n=1 Tax=Candidatus Hodgkinia cicadicola TaxID=573658 RepID=UPI00241517D9